MCITFDRNSRNKVMRGRSSFFWRANATTVVLLKPQVALYKQYTVIQGGCSCHFTFELVIHQILKHILCLADTQGKVHVPKGQNIIDILLYIFMIFFFHRTAKTYFITPKDYSQRLILSFGPVKIISYYEIHVFGFHCSVHHTHLQVCVFMPKHTQETVYIYCHILPTYYSQNGSHKENLKDTGTGDWNICIYIAPAKPRRCM